MNIDHDSEPAAIKAFDRNGLYIGFASMNRDGSWVVVVSFPESKGVASATFADREKAEQSLRAHGAVTTKACAAA